MQHPHPNPLPSGEGELKLLWNCCATAALRSRGGSRLRKEPQIIPISDALFLELGPVREMVPQEQEQGDLRGDGQNEGNGNVAGDA